MFAKGKQKQNRIENAGDWPIRSTDFFLVDDYEFPPSPYTEIFLVRAGNFLHETDFGAQAIRSGSAIIHYPSARHTIKRPDQVHLTRLRFLPEWFAGDFVTLLESPDVVSLVFANDWFDLPREMKLEVFSTQSARLPVLATMFELMGEILRDQGQAEPMARITLLEIMLLLGDDYHAYWRGGNRLPIPEQVLGAMTIVERSVASGGRTPVKQLQESIGMSQEELSTAFRRHLGMALPDFVQRRRLQHAAKRMLKTLDSSEHVAKIFGFKDAETFESDFEARFQFSPSVYREKFGGEPPALADGRDGEGLSD